MKMRFPWLIGFCLLVTGCAAEDSAANESEQESSDVNMDDYVPAYTFADGEEEGVVNESGIPIPELARIEPVTQEKTNWNAPAVLEMVLKPEGSNVSQDQLARMMDLDHSSQPSAEQMAEYLNQQLELCHSSWAGNYQKMDFESSVDHKNVQNSQAAISKSLDAGAPAIVPVSEEQILGAGESSIYIVVYGYRMNAKGLFEFSCASTAPEVWVYHSDGCFFMSSGEMAAAMDGSGNLQVIGLIE